MSDEPSRAAPGPRVLGELLRVFLRLGLVSFGGPAAHLALMEEELVRRRRWLTHERFMDLVSAANLVPGPNSTEVAIHVGWLRGGWPGLVVAGCAFILPAAVLVSVLAVVYVRYGSVPAARGMLGGIEPVVVAIVAHAAWKLARAAIRSPSQAAVAVLTIVAVLGGAGPLSVLIAAGLLGMMLRGRARPTTLVPLLVAPPGLAAPAAGIGLMPLFLVFVKIGSLIYGSGYVLLAFLRSELVEARGWLDSTQLIDAVAVGQLTPGPLFTTATFIGYLLAGLPGAVVATVGIFLPAFVFVAVSGPLVPRLRRSASASAFLDGVNAASWALIVVVVGELGREAIVDLPTLVLTLGTAVGLVTTRINSAWWIAAGALLGWLGVGNT
ncbi:MAG: chromate transporter [Isosphaeraceae bacterium]|nr:MAG: chromate transporter [Isosphaeraceae bacterium]